jgi:release factor glutamine methyltransferase
LDARRLVEEASGLEGPELVLALDDAVPARSGAYLTRMVERRVAGEPLQYVIGRWGFRRLDLMVDRRVLIPRPETEQVVEWALDEARALHCSELAVADLGTGSGAIALSLAVELGPGVTEVWATDVSADALDVTQANLAGIGTWAAPRVRVAEGSWWAALPETLAGRLHVVVSNPPYVADDEPLPAEVESFEPALALRAGRDGLDAIRTIVAGAPRWLARPGVLVVELAPGQAGAAVELARTAGAARAEIRADLAGRDRALVATWEAA